MASNNRKSLEKINMFHNHRNNLEEDPEEHNDVTRWWQWFSDQWNIWFPFVRAVNVKQSDDERLENIFNQLDRKGNGRIDIHDLSASLKAFGMSERYAANFLKQSDQDKSGDVGLAEFIQYVREHEKHLQLQFSNLDKNKDGTVDLEELISAFKELGLDIDRNEATKLLARMDVDGSLNISYDEWRDFLLLAPTTDLSELVKFWRHSTLFAN